MTYIDPIRASRCLSRLEKILKKTGLLVRLKNDFEQFREAAVQIDKKSSVTGLFSTSENTFTPAVAFWVGLWDTSDRIRGVVAIRFDDITGITLQQFLKPHWERVFAARSKVTPVMAQDQPSVLSELTGRTVYVGDLAIDSAISGTGAAMVLTKIAMVAAALRWNPDYIYGFNEMKNAERGFSTTLGFRHVNEMTPRWSVPPSHLSPDLHLVWNTRRDLVDLIESLADAPALAKTGQPRL